MRSNALTGKLAPARTRFITAGRLSSATVKITDIGCSWVTTTMPFGSLVLHVTAGVDPGRSPTRPVTGETMRQ